LKHTQRQSKKLDNNVKNLSKSCIQFIEIPERRFYEENNSLKMELTEKCKLVNCSEKKLIEAEITIENLKQNIDRVHHRVSYWKACTKIK